MHKAAMNIQGFRPKGQARGDESDVLSDLIVLADSIPPLRPTVFIQEFGKCAGGVIVESGHNYRMDRVRE